MGQLLQPNQRLLCHGANELFVGRAGYLCMARWMQKMLGKNVIPPILVEVLFNAIVTEGRVYSYEHRSQSPLMYSYYNTEYLGTTDLFLNDLCQCRPIIMLRKDGDTLSCVEQRHDPIAEPSFETLKFFYFSASCISI